MPVEECPAIQKDLKLSTEQCEQFLRERRSIRAYKTKQVPEKELKKLIETARYAPTGANSQSVEWLVMGNGNELKRLAGITVDWMRWMMENKKEIALSMYLNRSIKGWEMGNDVIFRDAPCVIVAHAPKEDGGALGSATIALAYLELAATAMGLGCCWAGYFQIAAMNFPPMIEAISLPEGNKCMGAMMVGYPRYKYHRLPLRNEPRIIWRI